MKPLLPSTPSPIATAAGRDGASLPAETTPGRPVPSRWTFLTNHTHVLILISLYPSIVLREVAARIGITERAVQRIIHELEQDGFIVREKVGRQNYYQVRGEKNLRHPIEENCSIQELLNVMGRRDGERTNGPSVA